MDQSPFLPQQPLPDAQPPVEQPQTPDDMGALADRWRGWINQPDNRAALMQFGIAMLQPMGIGESTLTHAANAVGHAGEAASAVHETEARRAGEASLADYRDRTAGSRETTADARMLNANSRGGVTQTASFMAGARRDAAFGKWTDVLMKGIKENPLYDIKKDPDMIAAGITDLKELGTDEGHEKLKALWARRHPSAARGAIDETGKPVPQAETEPVGGQTTDTGGAQPTYAQRLGTPAPKLADAVKANPNIKTFLDTLRQRFIANPNDDYVNQKLQQMREQRIYADPDNVEQYVRGGKGQS